GLPRVPAGAVRARRGVVTGTAVRAAHAAGTAAGHRAHAVGARWRHRPGPDRDAGPDRPAATGLRPGVHHRASAALIFRSTRLLAESFAPSVTWETRAAARALECAWN